MMGRDRSISHTFGAGELLGHNLQMNNDISTLPSNISQNKTLKNHEYEPSKFSLK